MSSSTARHRASMTARAHLTNASKAAAANRGVVRTGAVAAAAAGILMASVAPANASASVNTGATGAPTSSTTTSTSSGITTWTANGITYTWTGPNIQDAYRYFGLTGGNGAATTNAAPAATGKTPTASYSGAATVAPAAAPDKAPRATGGNQAIVDAAYAGLGRQYVWGGTSPTTGWDCSGFVQWAYAQAGKQLPRTEQWTAMTRTATPAPGDLVVGNGGSHVGIYVGNGQEISALNPTQGTLKHSVSAISVDGYYTLG